MQYITREIKYLIAGYRLMEMGTRFDNIICEGTLDEVVAAREEYLNNGGSVDNIYFQAHFPNGHPDYPGSWGVWVRHSLI